MKLKKFLVILVVLLIAMTLFACSNNNNNNQSHTTKNGELVETLDDLTDYSSASIYYNVSPVGYSNTTTQERLLQARIDEKKLEEEEDLSVPLKIFINSTPNDIIQKMSIAGLSNQKMVDTVDYLAGSESVTSQAIDSIVATGIWQDNNNWSLFDDWDYLDKLQEKSDNNGNNDDADNVSRQQRKIMRQIFHIGMTGDEFARLVINELEYAIGITNTMYTSYQAVNINASYDDYVKDDLSFDTLVYFKAFTEFKDANLPQTVQLYGYYYDYNKCAYENTSDDDFEKQLTYSHQKIFSNADFERYIQIQRNNYKNSYRYKATFYQKFYEVHFTFQGKLEKYDMQVYEIDSALNDENIKYSTEMKSGMEAGFAQQLILSDHLYIYSADKVTLDRYNEANTAYEQQKNSGKNLADEKELYLNLEKLKIVDYVLNKMDNHDLSAVLKYQIYSYSGDMIRNIQSEKKDIVLEQVQLDTYTTIQKSEIHNSETYIGRTNAIVTQLKNHYRTANPSQQVTTANDADWDGIRPEVKDVLIEDYSKYSGGTNKLEAFENLLIKKIKVDKNGNPWTPGEGDDPTGAFVTEKYDEGHSISRLLNSHETVLRYSIGEVTVTLNTNPTNSSNSGTAYDLSESSDGTYQNGNDCYTAEMAGATSDNIRTMPEKINPNKPIVPSGYQSTMDDSLTFSSGKTITEAMNETNDTKNFLTGNTPALENQIYESGNKKLYNYEFEGWYIDVDLKYKINEDEKIKYDLELYPGYKVTKSPYVVQG